MDGQTTGTSNDVVDEGQVDPWIAAFAALEPKGEEGDQAAAEPGQADGAGADSDSQAGDGDAKVPDNDEAGDGVPSQVPAGGLDPDVGEPGEEGSTAFAGMLGVTDESIERYEEELNGSIRDQAIKEIAAEFVKRGIRNQNGVLGATIEDPDICKRDDDGVPHYYNPETGREFTSDNPRRQAQEWVDDYNRELERVFDKTCGQYEQHLKEEAAPKLAVMKFAPKYEKLDDIRKGMFDNVVEDYEVRDADGKLIGYSCDLDKALSLVEKQIKMIQDYAKQHQPQQEQQPAQASGPALDMKTSSGAVQTGDNRPPSSLAEAMERLQDEQLNKIKR